IDKSKQRIRRVSQVLGLEVKAEPRRRKDADFVYLLAKPKQASSIRPMFKFHYASDLAIYANASIYRGYANLRIDRDLNQIIFTDIPWVISAPSDMDKTYSNTSLKRMYAFGFDALQLSERLSLMKNVTGSTLNGATGSLELVDGNLQRRTAIAQFKHGRAEAVNSNNSSQ
uniref:penicillin-binding protein activator n=1 Tax=uncultured Paraglaciecola sp. TaxID=1765024 RepID=UPI002613D903